MKEAISAGIILVNENGNEKQFLLLNYPTGHWDFIKGGIEDGESLHQTAIRETKEETGITDIEFKDEYMYIVSLTEGTIFRISLTDLV